MCSSQEPELTAILTPFGPLLLELGFPALLRSPSLLCDPIVACFHPLSTHL